MQEKENLASHLKDFKRMIMMMGLYYLLSISVCYYFSEEIFLNLAKPLAELSKDSSRKMIYTSLTEGFFTYLKLACYSGFLISFPFLSYELYRFLAPALYVSEKKILIPYLIMAPLLFIFGGSLSYFYIFPLAWKFFMGFEMNNFLGVSLVLEPKISEYLSLVLQMIIVFGLSFQLPVVLTLLCRFGMVSSNKLKLIRKYIFIAILIISAIVTPPDVISQIALAIPLYLLYELSIIACKLIEKKRLSNA